jgi:hypothetical protein
MRGVIHGGASHTLEVGVTVTPVATPMAELRQNQSQGFGQSQSQGQGQSQSFVKM